MGCDNKEEEQHGLLVENNIEDNEEQHDPRLFHNKSAESWFGNKRPTPIIGALLFFILVSILGNIGLLTRTHSPRQTLATRYAGLQNVIETTYRWNTEYSSANETEVNKLWMENIPWESGILAIEKQEAAAMGLPTGHDFPWDPERKGMYLITAHHMLHCIRNLYISVTEYREGVSQSIPHAHIVHCLDTLRAEVMCTADDTPLYLPLNGAGVRPGEGQNRICRDWDELQNWVDNHDPCFKDVDSDTSILEKMKYCHKDSPYLPTIRNYFGFDESWTP